MKKSTKIRFCSLPEGADCVFFKCDGKDILDTDIIDKITDNMSNPYIQIALEGLGWLDKVSVGTKDPSVKKQLYVVTKRDLSDMSYDLVVDMLSRSIPLTKGALSNTSISEIFEVVYGIQYMLSIKSKLGIDVCIIDGNTFDDYMEEN